MNNASSAALLAFAILAGACGGGSGDAGSSDSANRGALAADGTAALTPPAGTLPAGTTVEATIQEPISSAKDTVGQHIRAIVSRNIADAGGRIRIPGGSELVLTIAQLTSARGADATGGVIVLDAATMTVNDTIIPLHARIGAIAHSIVPGVTPAASRRVIVTPGTPITITLTQPLKISAT